MKPAKTIIADLAVEHMPKPAHNMFAKEVIDALNDAGYIIAPISIVLAPAAPALSSKPMTTKEG